MTEAPNDPYAMSPADAGAQLAAMSAAIAPPPPEAPTTAADAAARLQTLSADPAWAKRYFEGSVEARREFAHLTQLAASGDPIGAVMVGAPPDEINAAGPGVASLKNMADAVPALREAGLSDEVIRSVLTDQSVTKLEYDAVKRFQARRHGDKEWVAKLLAGDHEANRESMLMSIVLSSTIAEAR